MEEKSKAEPLRKLSLKKLSRQKSSKSMDASLENKIPSIKMRRSKTTLEESGDDSVAKSPKSPNKRFFLPGSRRSSASLSLRTKSNSSLLTPSSPFNDSEFETISGPSSLPATPKQSTSQPAVSSANDFFAKMGFWLYNTKVVQYIARGDERSRRKIVYSLSPLWLLGTYYQFVDDGTKEVTIPHMLGPQRTRKNSSLFNFPWGEDVSGERFTKEAAPTKTLSHGRNHERSKSSNTHTRPIAMSNGKVPSANIKRRNQNGWNTDSTKPRLRKETADEYEIVKVPLTPSWTEKNELVVVETPEARSPDDEEGVLVEINGTDHKGSEESVVVISKDDDSFKDGLVSLSTAEPDNPFWIPQIPRPKSLHEFPITPSRSNFTRPPFSTNNRRGSAYRDIPPTENQRILGLFLKDFESRIGFTYRRGFPPIDTTFYTSDTGFGCMHRTTMSLLASTLILHWFGRDWRKPTKGSDDWNKYVKLLTLFLDYPDHVACPFSIHQFALAGKDIGKKRIGEWLGPTTASLVVKNLVESYKLCNLAVHIVTDNVIYKKDINRLSQLRRSSLLHNNKEETPDKEKEKEKFEPTLILIATRLGVGGVNPVYYEALKACFAFPQSVGIAGGRPNSSLYFVGYQDDELICIDPHTTHDAFEIKDRAEYSDSDFSTFHNPIPNTLHISELDPSMLLGFYIRDIADFEDFCAKTIEVSEKGQRAIFTVSDGTKESQERKLVMDDEVLSEDEREEL